MLTTTFKELCVHYCENSFSPREEGGPAVFVATQVAVLVHIMGANKGVSPGDQYQLGMSTKNYSPNLSIFPGHSSTLLTAY